MLEPQIIFWTVSLYKYNDYLDFTCHAQCTFQSLTVTSHHRLRNLFRVTVEKLEIGPHIVAVLTVWECLARSPVLKLLVNTNTHILTPILYAFSQPFACSIRKWVRTGMDCCWSWNLGQQCNISHIPFFVTRIQLSSLYLSRRLLSGWITS